MEIMLLGTDDQADNLHTATIFFVANGQFSAKRYTKIVALFIFGRLCCVLFFRGTFDFFLQPFIRLHFLVIFERHTDGTTHYSVIITVICSFSMTLKMCSVRSAITATVAMAVIADFSFPIHSFLI